MFVAVWLCLYLLFWKLKVLCCLKQRRIRTLLLNLICISFFHAFKSLNYIVEIHLFLLLLSCVPILLANLPAIYQVIVKSLERSAFGDPFIIFYSHQHAEQLTGESSIMVHLLLLVLPNFIYGLLSNAPSSAMNLILDIFYWWKLPCSVVDPHWFHCGSGSGSIFFYKCGFRAGSGSREPNQCGSLRIRILARF